MENKEKFIVGLDLGTNKICAAVGVPEGNRLKLAGICTVPVKGVRKGLIISLEEAVQSIREALESAKALAGCRIDTVYLGIGGEYIRSYNGHGSILLEDKIVKETDVRKVIELAVDSVIPSAETEVIQTVLQEFIVDGQGGIQEPLEIAGERLEIKVHVISVGATVLLDVIKHLNMSGIHVTAIVLRQLASGEAVLDRDEKQLGVILMDIGGETTDIAVYFRGVLKHTLSVPAGGNMITRDIATVLKISFPEAEGIKKRYGCALPSMIQSDESIRVMHADGRRTETFSKKYLSEIIEARVEEFLKFIKGEMFRLGFTGLIASGIVITGGSARMEGMIEISEQIFSLPVRLGIPKGIDLMSEKVMGPEDATGVGLLLYGMKNREGAWFPKGGDDHNLNHGISAKLARWFKDFF